MDVRGTITLGLVLLAAPLLGLESLEALAQTPAPSPVVNSDLDGLAKDLALLLAEPGFRGFLRSEIAQSKSRESILELDKFLERAAKQPNSPPGLAKLEQSARAVSGKIKASKLNSLEGLDLYIPVEAHRAQWKGGEDFLVAFAPLEDEKDIRSITAYEVKTGKQVSLDPNKPPEQTVLVLVPEEHATHDTPKGPASKEDDPSVGRRSPDVTGKNPPEKPVEQAPGNSFLGLKRMYIRDAKEPWTRGDPELYMWFGQHKGYGCTEMEVDLRSIRQGGWYVTWGSPNTGSCNLGNQSESWATCWWFDSTFSNKVVIEIYEKDGSARKDLPVALDAGVSCDFTICDGDDYVDSTYMYRTNFPYNYEYRQDMGNAIVDWLKIP